MSPALAMAALERFVIEHAVDLVWSALCLGAVVSILLIISYGRSAPVNPIDWDENEPCGDVPHIGGCNAE